jgi:T5SS/PEP-CTERM-associated repeat protein
MPAKSHVRRRANAWHPIALAAALAVAGPAQATTRYWTFIGGCGSADWFGTIGGTNSEGQSTCWSAAPGSPSGQARPVAADDVFIQNATAQQPLLVEFAAPSRAAGVTGQALSLSMFGSNSFAAGLQLARGTLVVGKDITLGRIGSDLAGQISQSGGSITTVGALNVYTGDVLLGGGQMTIGQLNLRSQLAGARFTQSGGSFIAGIVSLGSDGGVAASFSQLAGTVSSNTLNIAVTPGAAPVGVYLSGAGTLWMNDDSMVVGQFGNGELGITEGANASSRSAVVGDLGGASGRVAVLGSGSQWKVDGQITLGKSGGSAELALHDGGHVLAGSVVADALANGGVPTLWVDGANTTLDAGNALVIGNLASADGLISAGAKVSSALGSLGQERTGNGSLRITGAGSQWTSSTSFTVGGTGGRGTLEVEDGAQLQSVLASVGFQQRGNGNVSLKGAQTRWVNSGLLIVGQAGDGRVTVVNGAVLDTGEASIGYTPLGVGRVEVNTANWTNHGELRVGQGGDGTLVIQRGASMSSGRSWLAEAAGSHGSLLVQNDESRFDVAGALNVGYGGTGSVDLADGGHISSGAASFGELAGSVGSAMIVARASWDNGSGNWVVGGGGSGSLNMSAGATARTGTLLIARDADSRGSVNLSGSAFTVERDLVVGNFGTADLAIGPGSTLSSGGAVIGSSSKGAGEVVLAGSRALAANWTVAGELQVGGFGSGKLSIGTRSLVDVRDTTSLGANGRLQIDGGRLTSQRVALGDGTRLDWRTGTLAITGTGATSLDNLALPRKLALTPGRTLNLTGTLAIGSGAELQLADGILTAGALTLNQGRVVATSPTAALDMSQIGALSGNGRVDARVRGGASRSITADGALALGLAGAADGYDFRGTLVVGGNAVTLADGDAAVLGGLTTLADGGRLTAANGLQLTAGRVLQSTGAASVQGRFDNGGSVQSTDGVLAFGGVVSGSGRFAGDIRFDAGLAPGIGVAALRFTGGDVDFGDLAMLTLDINGTSASTYDRLLDIGTLNFGGTLTLAFGAGFTSGDKARLALLDFDVFQGRFDPGHIIVTGLDTDLWQLDTSRLASNGTLLVQAVPALAPVPEPGTLALWMAGLAAVTWRARRTWAAG